jgi:hypothetical protein
MGRALRVAAGGFAYHVLNRANARMTIFEEEKVSGTVIDKKGGVL